MPFNFAYLISQHHTYTPTEHHAAQCDYYFNVSSGLATPVVERGVAPRAKAFWADDNTQSALRAG
jgi:hypothetical protein